MSDDIWSRLAAPFPPETIHWRVGSVNKTSKRGMALAFVDARDVMQRLDLICGPENWQCKYSHANGKTVCDIGIRVIRDLSMYRIHADGTTERIGEKKVEADWVWKADGAGDSDIEAEKGALSDAFKRAAVRWGIGRYLYDLPAPWVVVEEFGKSYRIAESELPRLQQLLAGKTTAIKDSPKAMALKGSTRKLMETIRGCASEDQLDELLADADVKELRADLARLLPGWSDGAEGGLEELIVSTRRAFKTGSMEPPAHQDGIAGDPDPFAM